MLWKKPSNLKYTELCMFIDAHIKEILTPGEKPELENQIYNYIWLVVKALAIKKRMFSDFKDYDPYSFYAATRLFFALRKNQWNQGKIIKGKLIRPIKSCLNYMKALLYPMKIEYQQDTFKEVMSEEFSAKKFDAYAFSERMKSMARGAQDIDSQFFMYLRDSFSRIGAFADEAMKNVPFKKDSVDYSRLKTTLMMNALASIKTKGRLDTNVSSIIVWKLPKSMASYVKVLLQEFYVLLRNEIIDCHKSADMDDATMSGVLFDSAESGLNLNYED